MPEIPRIQVPQSVIGDVPRPVVDSIPRTVINRVPPPVVRGIRPPVVDVPNPTIDYPTIDVPTREEFEGQLSPEQDETQQVPEDTRDLPTTPPVPQPPAAVTTPETAPPMIPGTDIPAPEMAPLVTAGATAVVTTTVALTAGIILGKVKDVLLEPMLRRLLANRKKKVKLKKVKPVIQFIRSGEKINVYQYGIDGTKHIDTTDDIERYLRDQVELDSLYEYDNKIIVDDDLKGMFTKEGAKRFKNLLTPSKSIAKKLSAKFSI